MPDEPVTPDAHPDRERLRDFLDDRLDGADAERVAAHVEGCLRCQRALEEQEPPLPMPARSDEAPEWDERRMRRAVRRALLRTAFDTVSIVLVVAFVGMALAGFVVNPLLVDRGDRVERARMAAHDLPILLTPGAVPVGSGHGAGLASHRLEHTFVRYVGSEGQELGTFTTRVGLLRWRPDPGTSMPGHLPLYGGDPQRPFTPDRLPEGTVASVQLGFADGITAEQADALADGHEEVGMQWVGFRLPLDRPDGFGGPPWWPDFDIGYSTCRQPSRELDGGRQPAGVWGEAAGTAQALEQARRATANLAGSSDIRRYLEGTATPVLGQIEEVAAWLADHEPPVTAVVLTGPTADLAQIAAESGADEAVQLGVDFYNGPGSLC